VTVWPALLRVAKSETRPRETRSQAVFWLGQAAGEAATAELSGLVGDDSVDREVRKQAVFALSQRPRDEAVPALVRVARTHRDPEIRKQALFWLGQSGDPRAIALFEELLTRR
jgi:HEAT repeat protein